MAFAGGAAKAISAASDFEENLNKVRVVFGPMTEDIEAFTKSAARNLGMSQKAALGAAGTFGNLFTAMKIGQPEAAEMSKGILKLSADLASFNNIKPEEALEKLRAGLVGETEPLRTLGVNLTAAAIEAKALAMGLAPVEVNASKVRDANLRLAEAQANLNQLMAQGVEITKPTEAQLLAVERAQVKYNEAVKEYGKSSLEARTALDQLNTARAKAKPVIDDNTASSLELEKAQNAVTKAEEALASAQAGSTGELTAAAKAQAAYALILEQTQTAQGDFSRTSTGMANSIRIIKATFADLQVQIGQQLLPLIAPLVAKFGQELPGAIDTTSRQVEAFVTIFKGSFKGSEFGGEFTKVETAAIDLGKAAKNVKDVFSNDLIPASKDLFASFKVGVDTAFPLVKGMFNFITENKEALIAAIVAIGVAIFIALGPFSKAVIALTLIITLLGIIKQRWQELQDLAQDPLNLNIGDNWTPDKIPLLGPVLQRRHSGGDVNAGQPYIVGKPGAEELFVPDSHGTIYPNSAGMAGGQSITVQVYGSILSERDIARVIRDVLGGGGLYGQVG